MRILGRNAKAGERVMGKINIGKLRWFSRSERMLVEGVEKTQERMYICIMCTEKNVRLL